MRRENYPTYKINECNNDKNPQDFKEYVNVPPRPVSLVGFCSAPQAGFQIANLLPHWMGSGNIGTGHYAMLLKNNLCGEERQFQSRRVYTSFLASQLFS